MSNFRVIIVGGGLSGPLLGNGLLANDVDFVLYERDAEDAEYEGYQIRLGEGALRGFAACLPEARTQEIMRKLGKSTSTVQTAPSLYTSRFEQLADFSKVPSYTKSSAIDRVVLRNLLMEPIKASKRVRYGKELTSYDITTDQEGEEKVKVHFRDGSCDVCDVLIGADGSRSKINQLLGLNNLVPLTSHWSFLSKGSVPYERVLELPEQLRKGPIIVMSKEVKLFYALYLPEDYHHKTASTNNTKLMAYDENAASFYWGLSVPVDSIPYKKAKDMKDRRQICSDLIKGWAPEFHKMLNIDRDDQGAQDLHVTMFNASTQPSWEWREKTRKLGPVTHGHPRVWLMGDAIHAMQPARGQGGNQAMSDCADALPQLLKLHSLVLARDESGRSVTSMDISIACKEI
ncbi:uncharacterized protein BKA55DRAFT_547290 [Fusarium redolens]|uniref:FAD-binding domain-containing protein n=1 Tax=Fusarium redolens TaxID=48865 RepID=A0A9P9FXN7_FUSRE|nr:uncharacterized protein BKA55DRAFT_547290 [Fusarium redolens]KAH7205126.1 hypothetical protein BKA55DRAFT_547290 [Fusarium redolens]